MANRGNTLLAILLALALVFLMAACTGGGSGEEESSAADTTAAVTEESTEDVFGEVSNPATDDETTAPSESTQESTEPSTAETTTDAVTTTADKTDSAATTTTKPVTTTKANAKPSTTAEIVAYFNTASNKVKTDKPGYSLTSRTIIDDTKVSSPSGFIDTIAPPIIRMAKSSWDKWSDPVAVAKGASHNEYPVSGQSWSSKLQADWVKSASCTESGSNFTIKIVMKDETVSELPVSGTTTKHGQVLKVFTKAEIADGASELGVNIQRFSCAYSGCSVEIVVDKASGSIKKATYYINSQVDMQVKLGFTLEASIPLAQEHVYTF